MGGLCHTVGRDAADNKIMAFSLVQKLQQRAEQKILILILTVIVKLIRYNIFPRFGLNITVFV